MEKDYLKLLAGIQGVFGGFRQWNQLEYADEWLLFPANIGSHLAIDGSSLSKGELYTFVTNRDARTWEQSLVVIVAGQKQKMSLLSCNGLTKSVAIPSRKLRLVCQVPCTRSSGRHSPKPAASSTSSISGNWHAMSSKSCASGIVGRPYSKANDEMEEAKLNARSMPVLLSKRRPARNCSYAPLLIVQACRQMDRRAKAKGCNNV